MRSLKIFKVSVKIFQSILKNEILRHRIHIFMYYDYIIYNLYNVYSQLYYFKSYYEIYIFLLK